MVSQVRRQITSVYHSLPPVYWVLWLGTLIDRLGSFVAPLLTFYLTVERGLSVAEAGLIVSLWGGGQAVASVVGGVIADRVGRRATMLLSLSGAAALLLALGTAKSLGAIAVLSVCVGFVGQLFRPAVAAFVSDVVPEADRLRAFGYLYWAINLGFSAAPVLAGLLARRSYFALFIADAVTMLAFAAIVALRIPETRPTLAASAPERHAGLRDVLADRSFVLLVVLMIAMTLVPVQAAVALAAHFAGQGHSPATYGAILAVNGVLIVLLQPVLTRWLAASDPIRVLAAASVIQGVGFFIHGLSSSVSAHAVAVAVWTVGEIISAPTSAALVANMAPPHLRGRYQGVFSLHWTVAACVGPVLGGQLLAHAEPLALWWACLADGVVVALGLLIWRRVRSRCRIEPS
ncbi:MAG: MFS transporter [Planctomycetales bacterium]|nr:MFS transporter [Planctomycetales bacterium]